jgi:dTMP kinase
MTRGRFIALEGGEGVGKSTQVRAVAAALRARGLDVVETREPGGSEGAEAIRRLLLEGSADRWTGGAEALLFAAARADHVAKTILPALEAGKWVVTDRFLDSSLAYQGGASGVSIERLKLLHEVGSAGLLPDRTLLLTLPAEEAARRAEARDRGDSDRIGGRGAEYHARVAESFAALAHAEPARFRFIDAQGDAEQVTARLIAALAGL